MMTVARGTFMAQQLFAMFLCTSWCKAQNHMVSVCMDEGLAESLSQFQPGDDEYNMQLLRYQREIADKMGIHEEDVAVRVPPGCVPEAPPPPPPTIARPNIPPPPTPPLSTPQTITQNMVLDISPEYAERLCTSGSTEQTQMILRFKEQTAVELSRCRPIRGDCDGCAPGTCFNADDITIDPTMFGWCVPKLGLKLSLVLWCLSDDCNAFPSEERQGQTIEHEMTVTVSDEWARALCDTDSPGYADTVKRIQQAVANNLGISDYHEITLQQLTSSLDCDTADHNDNRDLGNEVNIDVTDEYAHQLCDSNSLAFQVFKRAFQMQVAASINDACVESPGRTCGENDPGYIRPEQVEVDDRSILENAHCTEMAVNGMGTQGAPPASDSNVPSVADVDNAAKKANEDSSGFDLAVIVLVVACVGMGYRHKTRPPKAKYQAVNVDEEIPLTDYSIDSPSDSDRDRRDNPSFAGQFGAARIGSGKRR